ncbi:RluA family pseudouridine synthase [Candidatus Spongiihabitans sp.]|uniref:RluA family pseudouridine synthase n=1 Tax=Candidatus Spongiihabitans sp. TaxID=3101308 RepID=UPI003C7D82CC
MSVNQRQATTPKARLQAVNAEAQGQRIDNFLMKILKGVPKSRIYKAVRSGEVRVNGSRIKASHKLKSGDQVRIPPIRYAQVNQPAMVPPKLLDSIPVLFEDPHFLVVDKPAGLAVHGGTNIQYGLIEAFRQLRLQTEFLELAHRLDRETSGCLMLAKTRKALLALQQQLGEERTVGKYYLALVAGVWRGKTKTVNLCLTRKTETGKDKRSVVDRNGQQAMSKISPVTWYGRYHQSTLATLVEIELKTGRMHQARVHCSASGYPIAGDRLYGKNEFNQKMQKLGLGRLFLHAHKLKVRHPITDHPLELEAALPARLLAVLDELAG